MGCPLHDHDLRRNGELAPRQSGPTSDAWLQEFGRRYPAIENSSFLTKATRQLLVTDYHAKYYAHALTRRRSADDPDKLTTSLMNATVDLNPHQIDAAMFAFRSPLSRGAILADEVGLGKTIEAGLIISQLWAERKRRILIIVPTTLRKQWSQELAEKFFLDSDVFDSARLRAARKNGSVNPFLSANGIVICSYHFARTPIP